MNRRQVALSLIRDEAEAAGPTTRGRLFYLAYLAAVAGIPGLYGYAWPGDAVGARDYAEDYAAIRGLRAPGAWDLGPGNLPIVREVVSRMSGVGNEALELMVAIHYLSNAGRCRWGDVAGTIEALREGNRGGEDAARVQEAIRLYEAAGIFPVPGPGLIQK